MGKRDATAGVVLAGDLGGTNFRAGLVDGQGAIRADCVLPGPARSADGIDAEGWWACLLEAAARLADEEPALFASIAGVAICGVTRTQVLLGADDRPLRRAIPWNDARAEGAAARLRGALGAHPEAAGLNAFHPLARLAWLAEAEPEVLARLACVLEPKDYLNLRLTGARAGDAVSMARLLAGADALGHVGLAAAVLPKVLAAQQAVGAVRPGLPAPLDRLAGVPVFCCANDTWASVVGLGGLRPGLAYNISGTTEVLGVMSDRPGFAEGLLSLDWGGLWQIGGPSQTGADTASWLVDLLGRGQDGVAPAMEALLRGARHGQPVLFLPYLQGERVPYWNPALRGAFLGLHRDHGPADLAFAVLEGIGFLNRIVLERAEAALGQAVAEIRLGGGAAANPEWCRIKADICGRPVVTGAVDEPGLLGAAITAWTGLGRFASLDAAQAALVRMGRRFAPDPARRAAYDRLYPLFRQAEAALAPVSAGLAALSAPV